MTSAIQHYSWRKGKSANFGFLLYLTFLLPYHGNGRQQRDPRQTIHCLQVPMDCRPKTPDPRLPLPWLIMLTLFSNVLSILVRLAMMFITHCKDEEALGFASLLSLFILFFKTFALPLLLAISLLCALMI